MPLDNDQPPSRPTPERLTIDQTVIYDFLDPKRPRHPLAQDLFARGRNKRAELAIAPQGHRLDADGKLAAQIQQLFIDEDLQEARQLAYPTEATYPSDDLFPGQYVPGFDEAWNRVTSTWKTHLGKCPGKVDRMHVETHVLEHRDVFVTDDRPLRALCDRLRSEEGFAIDAIGLAEYMRARP